MAELNTLEEKLAEVTGLAQAAQDATEKIEGLVEDSDAREALQQMREEAEETERRCSELADQRDGKKTAILDKARETKVEATEMMTTYLSDDAGEDAVSQLVGWALPIQERHLSDVRKISLKLAADEDPYEQE
jgi:hypothetical protein